MYNFLLMKKNKTGKRTHTHTHTHTTTYIYIYIGGERERDNKIFYKQAVTSIWILSYRIWIKQIPYSQCTSLTIQFWKNTEWMKVFLHVELCFICITNINFIYHWIQKSSSLPVRTVVKRLYSLILPQSLAGSLLQEEMAEDVFELLD